MIRSTLALFVATFAGWQALPTAAPSRDNDAHYAIVGDQSERSATLYLGQYGSSDQSSIEFSLPKDHDATIGQLVVSASPADWHADRVLVAVRLDHGERSTYHYAQNAKDGTWAFSDVICWTSAEPLRIVDVHCPYAGVLELTLRRGKIDRRGERGVTENFAELLFADDCPEAGALLARGKTWLVDCVTGRRLEMGAEI